MATASATMASSAAANRYWKPTWLRRAPQPVLPAPFSPRSDEREQEYYEDDPSPAPQHQYRVVLPGGPVFLDAAWPEVCLAVEFDGAAFHTDPVARQRDLRRDAALAALGWVVLRFTFEDVAARPRDCAAQILAVYRRRAIDVPQPGIPGRRKPGPGTPSS